MPQKGWLWHRDCASTTTPLWRSLFEANNNDRPGGASRHKGQWILGGGVRGSIFWCQGVQPVRILVPLPANSLRLRETWEGEARPLRRTRPRSREGSIYTTGVCGNRWSRKAHNCVPEASGSDPGWEERWSLLHHNGLAESAFGFQSAAVSHSLSQELTPKGLMRSGWPATCFGHWPGR